MQEQQSGSQPFVGTGFDPQTSTNWIQGLKNNPDALVHVARQVFSQISNLDQTKRDQVLSQLRNDVKFTQTIDMIQPQTA